MGADDNDDDDDDDIWGLSVNNDVLCGHMWRAQAGINQYLGVSEGMLRIDRTYITLCKCEAEVHVVP